MVPRLSVSRDRGTESQATARAITKSFAENKKNQKNYGVVFAIKKPKRIQPFHELPIQRNPPNHGMQWKGSVSVSGASLWCSDVHCDPSLRFKICCYGFASVSIMICIRNIDDDVKLDILRSLT